MNGLYEQLPAFLRDRDTLEKLLFMIPAFPLAGFLLNGLFGRQFDRKTSGAIAVFASFASFIWASLSIAALSAGVEGPDTRNVMHGIYGTWFDTGAFDTSLGLYLDKLSSVMILVVTGIGTLIHLYSMGYMAHDPGLSRFFAYLNLFLFAMIILVLGDSLLMLFIGWEGVGLCSYLLIGFWYEDGKNAAAGMKAFVVNRIGDLGFLLGVFVLIAAFGTVNFVASPRKLAGQGRLTPKPEMQDTKDGTFVKLPKRPGLLDFGEALWLMRSTGNTGESALPVVGYKAPATRSNLDLSQTMAPKMKAFAGLSLSSILTVACLLLFVGACGKSAQIPLFVWLPDAMAGPTPVSALIHAATMVTAGVYMVVRMHGLFLFSDTALTVIAIVGGSTALFSALIGLTQLDIKKVLAYSTVSQLGYMFLGLGVGAFSLGIYHVLTHAFFKALLFLGAGSVIHAMSGEQDMRYMGGLRKKLPVTFWTMLLGSIALAGVPYTAGWYSKDEILASVLAKYHEGHDKTFLILYVMAVIGAFCTAFYTFRLIYLTFFGESRAKPEVQAHIHESPPVMTFPLVVLAIFSVIGGAFWHDKFVANPLGELGVRNVSADTHHVHGTNLVVTAVIAAAGILLATMLYFARKTVPDPEGRKNFLYRLSFNKFYVDEIYEALIVTPFMVGSELLYFVLETLLIDTLVVGSGKLVAFFSGILRRLQTGLMNEYAMGILVGALTVLYILFQH